MVISQSIGKATMYIVQNGHANSTLVKLGDRQLNPIEPSFFEIIALETRLQQVQLNYSGIWKPVYLLIISSGFGCRFKAN